MKQLPRLVPIVLPLAKDKKAVRLKFISERLLFHLLQSYRGDSILKKYSKVANAGDAKALSDYSRRTLEKLEASDDEDEA